MLTVGVLVGIIALGQRDRCTVHAAPNGAEPPSVANHDVMRCQRLELVDTQGRQRVVLSQDQNGQVGLQVYDDTGTSRAFLGVLKSGKPALSFQDADLKPRVRLGSYSDDDSPGLFFLGTNGKATVSLTTHTVAGTVLVLGNARGIGQVLLSVLPEGPAVASLADAKGEPRMVLNTLPNGDPAITMDSSQKSGFLGLGVKEGLPGMTLKYRDKNENYRLLLNHANGPEWVSDGAQKKVP